MLAFLGDIHGDWNLSKLIKKYDLKNYHIFQVGDLGIGWDTKIKEYRKLSYLNELLTKYNINLYAIRGNHDDPYYFNSEPVNLSNIKLLSDYSILKINNYNILCIGGAISVDRIKRKAFINKKGVGWWENEKIIYDEEKLKNIHNIDIIVSHSCPSIAPPKNKFIMEDLIKLDDKLLIDVENERNDLTKIYNILNGKIKYWIYGHMHQSIQENVNDTIFKCLDISEIYKI